MTVTLVFCNFFSSLARSSFHSVFWFYLLWNSKIHYLTSFFLKTKLGLDFWLGFGNPFVPENPKEFSVFFSMTDSGLCIYHFSVWLEFSHLYNSQWILFSTLSCLLLYFFYASFLHLLIMWLTGSFLPLHSIHLLFWVLPSFSIIISCVIFGCY